jgi:SMC interacting uncharacterized protein involved in chromosome segregation
LVGLERFFSQSIEKTNSLRTELSNGDTNLTAAIDKYRLLVDALRDQESTFDDLIDSLDNIVDNATNEVSNLDMDLEATIEQEKKRTQQEIEKLHSEQEQLEVEIKEKKKEFDKLRKDVTDSSAKLEKTVGKRVEALRKERDSIKYLTLNNGMVRNLAPLTQLVIKTYVVRYNKGQPLLLPPIILPEDRFSLPLKYQPLNGDLEKLLQKTIKKLLKDNPAFKTSFEKTCLSGNSFHESDSIKSFKKGIDELWDRQLLAENIRDKMVPLFTTLVGRCPECKSDIGTSSKFCPECGAALV